MLHRLMTFLRERLQPSPGDWPTADAADDDRKQDPPPGLSPSTRAALLYFCVGLGGLALAGLFVFSVTWPLVIRGHADFLGFYTGAALIGTDGLYSPAANREVQQRLAGFSYHVVQYVRLPFYAAALRPLALLPYQTAYWIFQTLSIAAAVIFVRLSRGPWQLTAAISVFLPLAFSIIGGQDITFLMVICGVAVVLHRFGRDAAAGFVLSLCLLKFHLFVLVPLVLIRHRKWRMTGAAAAGVILWLAISTLVAGLDWPSQYLAVLMSAAVSPNVSLMPNIRGVFANSAWAVYASIVVLAVFLCAIVKLRDFEAAFGIALAGGILLNTHSYVQDCTFLLPALISAIRCGSPSARGMALFLMTPIPYALVLFDHGGLFLLCVTVLALMRTADAVTSSRGLCSAT